MPRPLVFSILFVIGFSTLKGQALAGHIELVRKMNTVTAEAIILFRCCPVPAINHLKINWGDGSPEDSIPLIASAPGNFPSYYHMSFAGSHTYSQGAVFTVTAGNISFAPGFNNIPNSTSQKLVLRGMVNLQVFASPPTSPFSPLGDTVTCNFNHYDDYSSDPGMKSPDGDSLAFSIDLHTEIPGYVPPPIGLIYPGTGLISFTTSASGNYNVSFRTDAWRKNSVTGIYDLITGTSFYEMFVTVCNVYLPPITGISENYGDAEIGIFPNPVYDKLTVDVSGIATAGLKLKILNSLGQVVRFIEQPEATQEIDLSLLANGIYFLSVEHKAGHRVYKIVKE